MLAGTMARRSPKNPINDIRDAVGAWLGGNRGSVPSSGAGAAWQASARSAAQSGNRRIVEGLEEGVVQFGALGMGTSAQAQRDLMYGVPGAGTQAAKEASVSYVTGAAVGYGVGKVAGKVVQSGRVVNPVAAVRNKLTGREVWIHASSEQGLGRILPRTSTDLTRLQPDKALTFGVRTGGKGSADYIKEYSEQLTSGFSSKGTTGLANTPKSAYVTTTPSKTVTPYQYGGMWGRTTQSQQVVKEISLSGKTADQIARELTRGTRQAGGRLRKDVSAARKVSQKTKRAISKRRRSTDVIAPID
jgi:hypothetical protein